MAESISMCLQIVCSANLGKVVVWDPTTGAIQHELVGHNTYGAVRTCHFSPDGTMVRFCCVLQLALVLPFLLFLWW